MKYRITNEFSGLVTRFDVPGKAGIDGIRAELQEFGFTPDSDVLAYRDSYHAMWRDIEPATDVMQVAK